ncbi:MAG: hypothetical protein HXY23_01275 [Parvularculaceae bacterium]|jgi:xanthine dehydrogenase molybdopterin-binding subunit B|nr:hypothetical protein [Parvularculaceae bacterium]
MPKGSRKDIRKEQVVLLRFEKELARLAAFVAAGSATAASAATIIDGEAAAGAYDRVKDALVHLAEVTTDVHAALNAQAIEAGARILQAGGTPKEPPAEVVRSLLGLG